MLRQGERDEGIPGRGSELAAATGRDGDILPALHHVGARGGVSPGIELRLPKEFAGRFVKGVELFIPRRSDKPLVRPL